MKTKTYHRRSIRLTGYDYTQNGNYFLTICTRNRECLFGEVHDGRIYLSNYGRIVNECWQKIPDHFPQIILHEYVIMPNHVHGIIEMHNNTDTNIRDESVVGAAVGANNTGMCADTTDVGANTADVGANDYSPLPLPTFSKIQPHGTSRTVGSVVRGFKIGVTKQMGFSPWQRNFYEHIIRNDESYQHIVHYMTQNPLKWEEDCSYYGINGPAI